MNQPPAGGNVIPAIFDTPGDYNSRILGAAVVASSTVVPELTSTALMLTVLASCAHGRISSKASRKLMRR
jgi:hypothetical protein